MKLTRAAADLTLAAWTAPNPPDTTRPPADAAPAQPEPPAPCPIADPALTFSRLSRAIRQAMALEARLAAEEAAGTRFCPRPPPDPRRPILRQALHHAIATHPDRAELRRETDERLDDELAIDPDGTIPVPEILATICEDLGIQLHYPSLPDDLLGITPLATGEERPNPEPRPVPSAPWIAPLPPHAAGPPHPA